MEWATVNIDINKLIEICSNGRKTKEELLETFNIMNDKNIHEVFKYRKFNDNFTDKVTCYTDGTKVIGTVRPSYKEFLEKIFTILNVNPQLRHLISSDDQNLEDVLKARIEVLRTVQNEADLYNEFPILYKDLQDARKYINDLKRRKRELEKDVTKTPEEIVKEKERLSAEEKQFYRCALSPAFSARNPRESFINKQVNLYTRFVEGRKQYKELVEKTDYNKYIQKNFDTDKVALYVVNGYLKAINAITDRDKQLQYYQLVEKFLNHKEFDKTKEIIVDGELINYSVIEKNAKAAYNKINRVSIEVEWELLPTGSGYKTALGTTRRTISMSEDDLERLKTKRERNIQVGKQQTEYFNNTHYIAKAIGLKKFKGYFAYIYPNGVVVLEKDFKEKYPSTAEGAIYTMHAKDFELLSGIGKTDLIYNPLLIDHNYHNGDWQSKIDAYINQEGQEEDIEYAKTLIKRLEEHKKRTK